MAGSAIFLIGSREPDVVTYFTKKKDTYTHGDIKSALCARVVSDITLEGVCPRQQMKREKVIAPRVSRFLGLADGRSPAARGLIETEMSSLQHGSLTSSLNDHHHPQHLFYIHMSEVIKNYVIGRSSVWTTVKILRSLVYVR